MKSKKTVEERYQMLTPIEHVLKRPDTYVGSLDKQTQKQWILNDDNTGFVQKTLTYSPALYKIFDEVLVNAADNYQRDKTMDYLSVDINQSEGYVKIHNNGKGIPVVIHKENNMYVPQMIFGHLLTGSNFDDDNDQRFGGGRNGFGAKLANILSTKFSVECGDSENKKHFYMCWTNNMGDSKMPVIKDYKKKDFVEITFYPDFKRFGMAKFENDIVKLFIKRAYDMAGVLTKVKVFLNGKQIEVKAFNDYVDLYLGKASEEHHPIKIFSKESNNQHWEVILSRSDGELKQVSFVNGICTYKGGSHVNYVLDQIIPKISEKLKNSSIKTHLIKSKLFVFINCLIVNPKFDSQLKQTLTTRYTSFGSKWDMPDKMVKAILNTGIVQELSQQAQARQMTKMAKVTAGGKKQRLMDVPKLEDANDAGTSRSESCTLILTQGDSAKALAVAGLSVVGRDKYGVFPLRGKLLNVREKQKKSILQNAQISNVVKIIGLQYNKQYTDRKSLRYGSIMIMTDQDADGSHIKGLIINFINFFWPSLFKTSGFLRQFITPLLKVTKGQETKSFFTTQQYKNWASQTNIKLWKIKYYKGLGTSTNKEGQEYFKNINSHEKIFKYEDQQDTVRIDMAFSKKKADERKQWLANYDPEDIIQLSVANKQIKYKHFIDKQLKHFSNSNNRRAIPSVIDGFKPGQRKILFACFKRNLKQQIKVAQLAGYVAQHSAYHHGQQSLTQTIVCLAQNYIGSNNINLLMPNGQFGSRSQGGSDHASARYIFTCLNRITRVIFPEQDDHTLRYLQDDGQFVEPEFYVPIIPMVLINGVQGLGTGWSTKIPNFNPRQIVQQLRRKINGEPFTKILPWYKYFDGQTVETSNGVTFRGIMSEDSSRQSVLHVTQLPVGKWNIAFKQTLNQLINKKKYVTGYRQYHTQDKVHFEIDFQEDYLQRNQDDSLDKVFDLLKMSTKKNLTNMVAFNIHNSITRYPTSVEVMNQFFNVRLQFYSKRKQYLVTKLQREVEIISMKTKFILAVVENKLEIRNIKKKIICQKMVEMGFLKFSELTKVKTTKKIPAQKKIKNNDGNDDEDEENQQAQQTGSVNTTQFNYLLGMPIWNLTHEKVEALKQELCIKKSQLETLKQTKESVMWLNDLSKFLNVLDEVQAEEKQQRLKAAEAAKGVKNNGKNKQGRKIKKKKQSQSEDGSPKPKKGKNKNDSEASSQKNGGGRKRKGSLSQSSDNDKPTRKSSQTQDTPANDKKVGGGKGRKKNSKQSDISSRQVSKSKSDRSSKNSKSKKSIQSQMFKQPTLNSLFSKYMTSDEKSNEKAEEQSRQVLKQKVEKRKQKQAREIAEKNQDVLLDQDEVINGRFKSRRIFKDEDED